MKKTLIWLGIAIVLASGVFFSRLTSPLTPLLQGEGNQRLPVSAVVTTEEGKEIQVRVADTDRERQSGLSHFEKLSEGEGMLFVFDKPDIYPFWMKDMSFPLDIIWLKSGQDGGYRVVYVAEKVLPSTYPNRISPKIDADAVLEINSGLASVYNLVPEKKMWITPKK